MQRLVRYPEDRFSRAVAHIVLEGEEITSID